MTTDFATMLSTRTLGELSKQAGALPENVSKKAAKGTALCSQPFASISTTPPRSRCGATPGSIVLQQWVELYGRGDLLVEQAMIRRTQAMREGLNGPNPTALDSLLAERVVLAWVTLNVLELWQARSFELVFGKNSSGTTPAPILEVLPKHIDHAHWQLMSACQTLAKVRRAKLPDLLAVVNINTASPSTVSLTSE